LDPHSLRLRKTQSAIARPTSPQRHPSQTVGPKTRRIRAILRDRPLKLQRASFIRARSGFSPAIAPRRRGNALLTGCRASPQDHEARRRASPLIQISSLGNKHITPVSPPMTTPATAYPFDSSANNPARPRITAKGGPSSSRTPTRSPRGEPHPKPGMPARAHRMMIHGVKASQKLILPIAALSIF
jgi:hypothetical protein